MSPGQTGHITGQMGRVPGTDGTHTRGCPAKILYVYWFFSFPIYGVPEMSEFTKREKLFYLQLELFCKQKSSNCK